MSQQADFLAKLRAAAADNGGKPLGESRFYKKFSLSRRDLWNAGFESYGAACTAVDLRPNSLTRRLTDDELLRPLAVLARRLARFPPKGAIEVERIRDATFPSWVSFARRKNEGPQGSLQEILAAWCEATPDFVDFGEMLRPAAKQAAQGERRRDTRQVVKGFVYLMRYGSGGAVYKIGMTEDVARRHAQITKMAPQDVRVVHAIGTDDPAGIEQYWLRRFAERIVEGKKELFRLSPDDVAAFKSRKYQ